MKREPKDSGCCTGHDVPNKVAPESDFKRGFSKDDEKMPEHTEAFVETSRGFLTRPGGWER